MLAATRIKLTEWSAPSKRSNPMTDKYAVLDAAILARLKEGTYSFTELNHSPAIFDELNALAKKHNEGLSSRRHKLPFHFLYRRLQVLRKKGLIEFSAKWGLKADS